MLRRTRVGKKVEKGKEKKGVEQKFRPGFRGNCGRNHLSSLWTIVFRGKLRGGGYHSKRKT